MSTKQAYKQKIDAQMNEWRAEIDKLRARFNKADADTKIETEREIGRLEAKFDAAKAKMSELSDAGDEAWESLRKGIDSSLDSMKGAFQEAKAKFQS